MSWRDNQITWKKRCIICHLDIEPIRDTVGHVIWHGGHNPYPIADDGLCCSVCDDEIVTPARLTEVMLGEK